MSSAGDTRGKHRPQGNCVQRVHNLQRNGFLNNCGNKLANKRCRESCESFKVSRQLCRARIQKSPRGRCPFGCLSMEAVSVDYYIAQGRTRSKKNTCVHEALKTFDVQLLVRTSSSRGTRTTPGTPAKCGCPEKGQVSSFV